MDNLVVQEQYKGNLTDNIVIQEVNRNKAKYTLWFLSILTTVILVSILAVTLHYLVTEPIEYAIIYVIACVLMYMYIIRLYSSISKYLRQSAEFKIKMDLNSFSILVNDVETRGVLTDIEKIVLDGGKYRLTINGKYLYLNTAKLSTEDKQLLETRLSSIKPIETITV